MNQSFGFASKLGDHYVNMLLNEEKDMTNREDEPEKRFRRKCRVGDWMHRFFDMRTKQCVKLGSRKVIERYFWNTDSIPPFEKEARVFSDLEHASPRPYMSWFDFAMRDGFETYADFVEFFSKRKTKDFICFVWRNNKNAKITDFT